MHYRFLLLLLITLPAMLTARTIEVRPGGAPGNLQAAASAAAPGDTILFRGGIYPGDQYIRGFQGAPGAWITIMAAPGEEVILRGGGNAWQLSDPAYLRIEGFVLEGQTGNGMNIDDDGSFETPAHHIVIERCAWRGIAASGNNDQLKLSGLDSFEVRDCLFNDGAAGGSMIDMVGCHAGSFLRNRFERGGSNAIQAKGGTRHIVIERNTFIDAGLRALNIGGSTGLQFFRPQGANYEAADIHVYSNTFVGSDAPIAFVGAVNSDVVNNTLYLPKRWAVRILQETVEEGFIQCGENSFRNNIVVVGNLTTGPAFNIGPNTRPATFTFSNNLWYNIDNGGWGGPNLPAPEMNGILGRDPMLAAPPADMTPRAGSPAIGAGYEPAMPLLDHRGRPFALPRSIGAVEGSAATNAVETPAAGSPAGLAIVIRRDGETLHASCILHAAGRTIVELYDTRGERLYGCESIRPAGEWTLAIPLGGIPHGPWLCVLRSGRDLVARPVIVAR